MYCGAAGFVYDALCGEGGGGYAPSRVMIGTCRGGFGSREPVDNAPCSVVVGGPVAKGNGANGPLSLSSLSSLSSSLPVRLTTACRQSLDMLNRCMEVVEFGVKVRAVWDVRIIDGTRS